MQSVAEQLLVGFNVFVLGYFVVLNTLYLVLTVIAAAGISRHLRRLSFAGYDEIFANPLTPPVTMVLPAHDEEAMIVGSVEAMLALRFSEHEVIVVDDGSTDATFERLRDAFGLIEIPIESPGRVPVAGAVLDQWVPADGRSLVVIRKTSVGSKGDAANVGIDVARYPLVCITDADAILDEDALLHLVKPFVDDPRRVVATGGTVRAVNDCVVHRGRVVETRLPRSWLARIQVIEYLRSFLLGRVGWSRLQGLLIISGAFGLFRKDLLVELGGFREGAIGEDADLVARIHRTRREQRRPYRVEFVSEPVCWTEVPDTLAVLGRQRRRWSRGLADVLTTHRRMIANPRYGRIGLVVMPYYVAFELLGPFIELIGLVSVVVGLSFGLVDTSFALLFFAVAFGYGILLSVLALVVEEFTYRRYSRRRDLPAALAAIVVENVGFRQLHAWWRLRGVIQHVRGGTLDWGAMTRTGFTTEGETRPSGVVPTTRGRRLRGSRAGLELADQPVLRCRRGTGPAGGKLCRHRGEAELIERARRDLVSSWHPMVPFLPCVRDRRHPRDSPLRRATNRGRRQGHGGLRPAGARRRNWTTSNRDPLGELQCDLANLCRRASAWSFRC